MKYFSNKKFNKFSKLNKIKDRLIYIKRESLTLCHRFLFFRKHFKMFLRTAFSIHSTRPLTTYSEVAKPYNDYNHSLYINIYIKHTYIYIKLLFGMVSISDKDASLNYVTTGTSVNFDEAKHKHYQCTNVLNKFNIYSIIRSLVQSVKM